MLYKKIDSQKVLALDLFLYSHENKKLRMHRFGRALRNLVFKMNFTLPETEVVFFQSMRRGDYDAIFNKVVGACSLPKDKVVLDKNDADFDFKFLYYLLVAISSIKVNFKNIEIYLFSLVSYASYIKYLSCINEETKLLVVHADMQPIDNLLSQAVNIRGGKTVTLQHGLYVDYGEQDNVNKYNYINCVSKYFLAWGDETASLINKYIQPKVLVCGKPDELIRQECNQQNYFTVIFDQNIYHKQNVALLKLAHEICERLNLKMNLRLHPRNKLAWYRYDAEVVYLNKSIEESSFVIGHTSSLIYECMRAGVPAFRYNTNVPANQCDERIIFNNIEEFFDKYKHAQSISFEELGQYYIKCCGEESLTKYGKALYNLFHTS